MNDLPLLDLGRLHSSIHAELTAAIERVIQTGAFVGGGEVSRFEEAFGELHGCGPAAAVGSGTDALHLALRAVGVQPGDEVIVPALTFPATAEAVVHAGGTPVFADVDRETLLVSSETVEAAMSPQVRAIIPVHLYGNPVPFSTLVAWQQSGLAVVEDAAQAHSARWAGRPVGSVGDAACFSFYPGKNLGALGDGGAVVSQDPNVVNRIKQLRDHGRSNKHTHLEVGYCSRLDGLQAAVLNVKLRHLEVWNDRRRRVVSRYERELADLSGVAMVPWTQGAVHHQLVVRVSASNRDSIRSDMSRAGISTGIHYPIPLSQQTAFATWRSPCPSAERAAQEIISLPMDPLMKEEDIIRVCETLASLIGHYA